MGTMNSSLTRSLTGDACVSLVFLCGAVSAHSERLVLKHKEERKVPTQEAWDTFKNFKSSDKWPGATENTVPLFGKFGTPLAVAEFQLKGCAILISELQAYDEHKRWFDYRVIKTDLTLPSHEEEMWIEPVPTVIPVVPWSAQFHRPEKLPKPEQAGAATTKLVQVLFKACPDNIAYPNLN